MLRNGCFYSLFFTRQPLPFACGVAISWFIYARLASLILIYSLTHYTYIDLLQGGAKVWILPSSDVFITRIKIKPTYRVIFFLLYRFNTKSCKWLHWYLYWWGNRKYTTGYFLVKHSHQLSILINTVIKVRRYILARR